MRDLSLHNPTKRKLPPISRVPTVTKSIAPTVRADSEVTSFIWGISIFVLFFSLVLGGVMNFVIGLVAIPIMASLHVLISKMGGKRAWAWVAACLYCLVSILWLVSMA